MKRSDFANMSLDDFEKVPTRPFEGVMGVLVDGHPAALLAYVGHDNPSLYFEFTDKKGVKIILALAREDIGKVVDLSKDAACYFSESPGTGWLANKGHIQINEGKPGCYDGFFDATHTDQSVNLKYGSFNVVFSSSK